MGVAINCNPLGILFFINGSFLAPFSYCNSLSFNLESTGFRILGNAMPARMMKTPIHWKAVTGSFRIKVDMNTAVGSSEALKIFPSALPIFGIPILNNRGGRSVPKNAK